MSQVVQQSNHFPLESSADPADWVWRFWWTVPLYPYRRRRTLRKEIVKDTVWTFDQIQGIIYVAVPIRMTIVRLAAGGLLVYAPVAPTRECIRLVRELEAQHGAVKYIILPTVSGLEHKVFVGPFARHFPDAQVYVAPNQWSFPVNLPLSWLGFPVRRTHILSANPADVPFTDEFDYALLHVPLKERSFGEVALHHRATGTLLVADSVLSIPNDPPDVVQLDPYPLLFHARDNGFDRVTDSEATRQKGWHRVCLFAFYFRPSALETVPLGRAWREAQQAEDRSRKALFGLFPFAWQADWERSFEALRGEGRLFVAPILQTLILNRAPQETLAWVDQIAQWDFQQIIPCHFDAPIAATPQEFRQAFAFLDPQPHQGGLLPEDFEFLKELEEGLVQRGITPPAKVSTRPD